MARIWAGENTHNETHNFYPIFIPLFESKVSAQPPAEKTAGQIEKETLKKRISNHEYSAEGGSKEGILTILKKDRAQRLHPSAFHIPTSAFVKCSFIRGHSIALAFPDT